MSMKTLSLCTETHIIKLQITIFFLLLISFQMIIINLLIVWHICLKNDFNDSLLTKIAADELIDLLFQH